MAISLPAPQPKQILFMTDTHKVVCFGGARGGGKSFAVDEKAIIACSTWAGLKATIIRRTYPELKDNHIEPLKKMLHVGLQDAVAKYNNTDKDLRFVNGSVIRLRSCDTEQALDKIQGQETDLLFIDEAGNFPEEWIKKMYACVRGTNGFPKRIYLTCNPSGIGMGYIKRVFIDRRFEDGEDPEDYTFIQSLVTDNLALMQANPDYVKQLQALPPKLREAWLNGRWDVFEGMFFEELRLTPDIQMCADAGLTPEEALRERRFTHVIEPFDIPQSWNIERSYDFGFGKPFSVGWWAIDHDGRAYRILELYGCTKVPNEGLKWSPSQQMSRIAEIENTHPWLKGKNIRGVADPAIWEGSHGISIAEVADQHRVYFEKGVNDRIAGWMQVRERLKFNELGFPMMYAFNNCQAFIRTMPLMMFDDHKPEDLDTDLEDHCPDDVRYFCMSRPIAPTMITSKYKPLLDPLNQYRG